GYHTINNSFFDIAGLPAETIETFLPTKTKYITAQTFISRLVRDISFNLITRFHLKWMIKKQMYFNLKNNQFLYGKTTNIIQSDLRPKFVFSHLMLPHYPFYFDERGNSHPYDTLFKDADKAKYLSYLKYANSKYIALIDQILKNSKQPPLIIFMSDHGFRDYNADPEYLFVNICAVYFPDKEYSNFYNSLSGVNLFRVILNTKFNQHLPILKDSTIILKD
ncbi:MAG: hypothetical protein ICV66_05435, partial [Chitinophagaceae bacterium]|nr:hypothetical protein [Chitinophagaceae bacterium]